MHRRQPGPAHIDRLVRAGVLLVVLFAAIVTSASASAPTSTVDDTPASTRDGFDRTPEARTIDTMLEAMASQGRFSGAVLVARNGHVLLERAVERLRHLPLRARPGTRLARLRRAPFQALGRPDPAGGLLSTEFADQHDPRWHATFTVEHGHAVQLRMRNIPRGYSFLARRTDAPSRRVAGHDSRVIVPRPTGTLPVGTATLTLVDRARPDPFASDRERRRILAQVYYPSADGDGARARYLPPGVARALPSKGVPATTLSAITTNAQLDARARQGRYPVLIFSPGYSVPHALYTGLLEDLASRGYVVIAVDHTRETEAVQFSNGEIVRRTLPVDPRSLILKAIKARTSDVTFVIKSLDTLRRRAALAGADTSKIGLLGHSLGGLTAANVGTKQPAIACAADIAGSVYGDARLRPFRRPFLILDGNQRESTLPRWWSNLKGVRYWVTLTPAKHLNFTDWTWLVPTLEARGLTPHVENLGAIDGRRALNLERRYVGSFFDECLKHQPSDLFNDPRPQPDVRIRH
jgi:dienelactone hydrolase